MAKIVERTVVIDAPPERVWRAWVDEMFKWWTAPFYNEPELVTGLMIEPQLGGRYIEQWGEGGAGYLIGTVVEWLPPKRIAYTWTQRGWDGVSTLVRITLEPHGDGSTRFAFTQSGFERLPDAEGERSGYEYGSGQLLDRLKAYVEKETIR